MHDEAVGGAERFQSHLRAMSRNTPDRTNLLAEVPTLIKDGMEKKISFQSCLALTVTT